ncbi:DUF4181 domain-containing protein [Jeotgalibacillus salarius]|uniref:DUF4181 domain-containing protein n=1 Tax=Jeotgalibacillus salarius TaxID=546023 RepID=A0A4Y8LNF7_9BACL|nr:DUF4181 domain-containing protein [Jeotgalibacillus salarius]TFE02293.1 DUF4181 domain-containing protein [Jeotgalibacillus salarius]
MNTLTYGLDENFWWKLLFIVAVFLIFYIPISMISRRLLGAKRGKIFSTDYVNAVHKKADWVIRGIFIAVLIIGFIINAAMFSSDLKWYLQPYFFMFVFIGVTELLRAFMEWKYEENRKAYLYTLIILTYSIVFLLALFFTDGFGLFLN